jgi:hypothetical protein
MNVLRTVVSYNQIFIELQAALYAFTASPVERYLPLHR